MDCLISPGEGTGSENDGQIQPALTTDAPCGPEWDSMIVTSAPRCTRKYAVLSPITPEPTTTTCVTLEDLARSNECSQLRANDHRAAIISTVWRRLRANHGL